MNIGKLSEQVRRAAELSGLGSNDLARLAGLDKSAMSRFMNSKRGLSVVRLERLAAVLGYEIALVVKKEKGAGSHKCNKASKGE